MKKIFFFLIFILYSSNLSASIKENIIQNLKTIENVSFDFEQNINGKIEKGKCKIQYPKKIFCEYDLDNKKILISDGKSLVVKTLSSYYLYPLEKTPLNFILDKFFLVNKIDSLQEKIIEKKYVNFSFVENENEINLFFDKKNFNLIGWQTQDIYQNLSIMYISSIRKNEKIQKNLFNLPLRN
tara:strand:+ start:730 stop:1278 length:549 start_codon:yes stop_codon:yes gene_type:complete